MQLVIALACQIPSVVLKAQWHAQGRLLSEWDDERPAPMPPPRIVDPALRQSMRLVDFIGSATPKHTLPYHTLCTTAESTCLCSL